MLDEAGPKRKLKWGKLNATIEERRGVFEIDAMIILGQLTDDARIIRGKTKLDSQLLHRVPRFREGCSVRASNSAMLLAGGGWRSESKSSILPSA